MSDPMRGDALATGPCGAKTRSGKPCPNAPMRGATRCRQHGGASPGAQAAAKRRLLEARVRAEMQQRVIEPVVDPVSELAMLGGEVLAWLGMCRQQLARLEGWDYRDLKGSEDVRAYVAVYERALDRAVVTMERMSRLGLDAETLRRQLQIAAERPSREQAQGLARVVQHVLGGLGLSPEQQAAVPALMQAAMTSEGLL